MDLGNLLEILVHYLLIEGMVCLSHRDRFPMVSTLVCMVTHWIRLIVNYDVRLLIVLIHHDTIFHRLSTLGNIELMPNSTGGFNLWERP